MMNFPNELLLEIVSYFPPVKITIAESYDQKLERRYILQSLSEVCRRFRQLFRPYLWQRIEVYGGIRIGNYKLGRASLTSDSKRELRVFAKELSRQLSLVTDQDPDLAQYVRSVDILINDVKLRPVFEQLGRCFSLFPNLHTVKIRTVTKTYFEQTIINESKRGFKLKTPFPQIRSAILSSSVYHLLRVCPNLESLAISEPLPRDSTYAEVWPGLQSLYLQNIFDYSFVVENFSSLRELTVSVNGSFMQVEKLAELIKNLKNPTTIIVHRYPMDEWTQKRWMAMLLGIPPHDRQNLKEVILTRDLSSSGFHRQRLSHH